MSDPESRELALPLDSKWALLKPNLEPQRETTPLCILLGCSLASSWAQGHSLVSRETGFLSSPTSDLDHVSQLSATCQCCSPSCPAAASRPARPPFNKAAVFAQTGPDWGSARPSAEEAVSLACVTEATGSPLRTCRLCFLSLSTLWQVLARTDARAANGRAGHLVRVIFPPPSSPPLSSKAGGWRPGSERGKR